MPPGTHETDDTGRTRPPAAPRDQAATEFGGRRPARAAKTAGDDAADRPERPEGPHHPHGPRSGDHSLWTHDGP